MLLIKILLINLLGGFAQITSGFLSIISLGFIDINLKMSLISQSAVLQKYIVEYKDTFGYRSLNQRVKDVFSTLLPAVSIMIAALLFTAGAIYFMEDAIYTRMLRTETVKARASIYKLNSDTISKELSKRLAKLPDEWFIP
jgi:hypothetical protein